MSDNNAFNSKPERINYSNKLDELEGKISSTNENNDTQSEPILSETKATPINAEATITISSDRLTAYIRVTKPENGGSDITIDSIKNAMNKAKIRYGIDEAALESIANDKIYDTLIEIARGEPPVDGEDAVMQLKFTLPSQIKPKLRPDGSMDFKELDGLINNVKRGDLLCVVKKETAGKTGMDVCGVVKMQRQGKPLKRNPSGTNTIWLENETLLVAESDGNLEYHNDTISVSKVFTIQNSVDMSTGNIDFAGSIIIKGDVRAGFSVKANGSIRVVGVVEGATLTASGDITVDGGINGMNRGIIVAGGTLKTKFIENCRIEVTGNIFAESIMSSHVRCDSSLEIMAGKGIIIGGTIVAAKNISVKVIGSQSHIATSISIGSSLMLDEKISAAKLQVSTLTKEVNQLIQIIDYCQPLLNENKLSPERIKMLKSAISGKVQKTTELELATSELEQLNEEAQQSVNSVLNCREQIFTGTKIKIVNEVYSVTTDTPHCSIYLADDKIVIGSYLPS